MKTLKIFMIAVLAIAFAGSAYSQSSQSIISKLTSANGLAAGKSLLALYNQYKADGKFDLNNSSNITNVINLISNVAGLTSSSTAADTPEDFLSGLISGSENLVNTSNSDAVLKTLGSISGLNTGSFANIAAAASSSSSSSTAATINSLVSKAAKVPAISNSANEASSLLNTLFQSL